MDEGKLPGTMSPEARVSAAKDKSGSKGSKSPTKVGSPKASPAQAKKVSQDAHVKTGADESTFQDRCQVLEEHLTKERLAKAQLVEQRKEKDATIAKLEAAEKKAIGKWEEEKRRAENAAERERKAKQEHDEMKGKISEYDAKIKQVQEDAEQEREALKKALLEERLAKEKLEAVRDAGIEKDQKGSAEVEALVAKIRTLESANADLVQELRKGLEGSDQGKDVSGAVSGEVERVREELERKFAGDKGHWEEKAKKQREVSNNVIRKLSSEKEAEAQRAEVAQKRVEELEKENKKLVHDNKKLHTKSAEAAGMESSLTLTSAALDARLDKAEAKNRALVKEREELLQKVSSLEKVSQEMEQGLAEERSGKAAALREKQEAFEKLVNVEKRLVERESEMKKLRAKGAEAAAMESTLTLTSAALDAGLEKADAKNRALLKEKDELLEKLSGLKQARAEAEERLADERNGKVAALKEKDDALGKLAEVETRLVECARELERVSIENGELKDSTEKMSAEVGELKAERTAREERNALLVKSQDSLQAERQRLEAEVGELRESVVALTTEIETLRRENVSALEQSTSLGKAKEAVEAEKEQLREEVKGLALEQKKLTAQLQVLKEEKQVVVEQGTRHAKMKEALEVEKEQLGAELAQLLERMQGPKPQGGRKQEAREALKSVAAKVDEIHEKLVDLEHRSELLAQAEEEREAAVRASAHKEAEIGRLREEVLTLEGRAVEAEAKVSELQEALQAAQAQLAQITGFSRAKDEEIRGLWKRVQEAARNQEEHEALRQKVAQQMEDILAAEARGRESEAHAKDAEVAAREQEEKMSQVEEALKEREEDLTGLKEELRSKEADLEALQQQLRAQKSEGNEARKEKTALQSELHRSEESGKEERERSESLEAELQKEKRRTDDLTAEVSAARTREEEFAKRLVELEKEKVELHERLRSEADARVRELAEKLAAAEADLAQKLSGTEAEWAQKLSDAEAAAAERLAAAQEELRTVRADLQRAKQELMEQKERWEREKCEQAERHVEERERVARERARAVEHLEKEVEESGGAIQKLREGITRRDVEIKDLQTELLEAREGLEKAVRVKEEEMKNERAQAAAVRERLTEELASKDAELKELRREVQEIQVTVSRHKEEDLASPKGVKEISMAQAGPQDDVSRRKEELRLIERVVQSKEASPSRVKAWARVSDPGLSGLLAEEKRALPEGAGKAEARVKPPAPRVRVSFLGRREGSPGLAEEECATPIQEKFDVEGDEKTALQERLREKEEALEVEVSRRQKIEKQLADANSLLALRTAEASRLENTRRHVAALEEQVCTLQQELADETARVSELTVHVADREVELARLKDVSLGGLSKEPAYSNGSRKAKRGSGEEGLASKRDAGRADAEIRAGSRKSLEGSTTAEPAENGAGQSEDWLQRELREVRGHLELERAHAEAAGKELHERLAERERDLGERTQELRNLEQQLEDEEGDKRRILSQMDYQRTQIDHLQQQLYGKKKSMDRLLTRLSDNERTLEQLRISPGQSPRSSFSSNGDRNSSPGHSPSGTGERISSPRLPLTTSVTDLERLRAEAESEHRAELVQRLEQGGVLERKELEEEVPALFSQCKALQAALEESKKRIAELREQALTFQGETDARDAVIEALREELDVVKVRVESDAGKLREEAAAREGELARSVADLKARVAEKEKLLDEGDSKFEELRGQIAGGEERIRTLRGEVGTIRGQLSEREDYLERLEGEIGEQAAMLVRMQDDIAEKERQLAEWEGLAEAHETEVELLRRKVESLKSTEAPSVEADDEGVPRRGLQEQPDVPEGHVASGGSLEEQLEAAVERQKRMSQELSAERREWESRLVRMKHEREGLEKQVVEERKLKNQALKSVQVKLRRFQFELGEVRKERAALHERVQGLARVAREGEERVWAAVEERLNGQSVGVVLRSPRQGWLGKLTESTKGKREVLALDYKAIGRAASRDVAASEEEADRPASAPGVASPDSESVSLAAVDREEEVAGYPEMKRTQESESGLRQRADDILGSRGDVRSGDVSPSDIQAKGVSDDGSRRLGRRTPRSSYRMSPRGSGEVARVSAQEERVVAEEERDQGRLVFVVVCTVGVLAVFVVTAGRLGLL
ncbi:hypothetical protein KFL_000270100 [Klebsormidium nitens]|uniref:Uncharacterized protein n=1 Tax=Klebsormidium nitens TaxID=105231 RepID=A0A1Y1HQI5_KLENI|nr:hypothetical protein KFL_000270100 [Klebsormidium nitens]|eukprot:GAQ79251.1 hypothetical protein KFL_000270100 [Klebsormidium nitens]